MNNERGYIKIVLVIFTLLIGLMIFPIKFPTQTVVESSPPPVHYCRDLVDDPNAPTVEAPSYTADGVSFGTTRTYRLIKENVAIDRSITLNETPDHHYFPDFKEPYTNPQGKRFLMRIPNGQQGRSYKLQSEAGGENYLQFADYGLLYLFHADDSFVPVIDEQFPRPDGTPGVVNILLADIYKAVDTQPLPEWVLTCYDQGENGLVQGIVLGGQGTVYTPPQDVSVNKQELQLEWFLFAKNKVLLQAWWVPHCKPAVYLYPKKRQLVNVKVFPDGYLTYVDPPYDSERGWTVEANPNGELYQVSSIEYGAKKYGYLYYESKIRDEAIDRPEKGWVVKYTELEGLYKEILPKLGLNEIQSKDFIEYWTKALPQSPYYFVGIIDQDNVNQFEKLEITPKPDFINRVRVYFERLDSLKDVEAPVLAINHEPITNNFKVVEWGGMVKNDPNHPFTCSQ